mmetsp:Transcript_17717/g.49863  ORF Transcript_17717/g.49863 Transcript_17717/m.49863 type:complete len:238 (-) Transcript_17717:2363-3076(-)
MQSLASLRTTSWAADRPWETCPALKMLYTSSNVRLPLPSLSYMSNMSFRRSSGEPRWTTDRPMTYSLKSILPLLSLSKARKFWSMMRGSLTPSFRMPSANWSLVSFPNFPAMPAQWSIRLLSSSTEYFVEFSSFSSRLFCSFCSWCSMSVWREKFLWSMSSARRVGTRAASPPPGCGSREMSDMDTFSLVFPSFSSRFHEPFQRLGLPNQDLSRSAGRDGEPGGERSWDERRCLSSK